MRTFHTIGGDDRHSDELAQHAASVKNTY
jgi:hypothetical protein